MCVYNFIFPCAGEASDLSTKAMSTEEVSAPVKGRECPK